MKYALNKLATSLVAVTLALFVASPAAASNNCKRIWGTATFPSGIPEENCSYEAQVYDLCFRGTTKGNLRGPVVAYQQADWFKWLEAPDFAVPEGTIANYNREFIVFSTRRGELYGDAQYVFDLRIFDVGAGFVDPVILSGGTGMYEGATGYVAMVFTEYALENARVRLIGEVCGPHIPSRDNDEGD